MKADIHPNYAEIKVTCSCGNEFMILVCGGCANIPGIADVISSRVGIPTEVGDPLGQMKISSKAKSQGVTKDATALLTACGLALRSFD